MLNIVFHVKGFGPKYMLREFSQNMGRGFGEVCNTLERKVCKTNGFVSKYFKGTFLESELNHKGPQGLFL